MCSITLEQYIHPSISGSTINLKSLQSCSKMSGKDSESDANKSDGFKGKESLGKSSAKGGGKESDAAKGGGKGKDADKFRVQNLRRPKSCYPEFPMGRERLQNYCMMVRAMIRLHSTNAAVPAELHEKMEWEKGHLNHDVQEARNWLIRNPQATEEMCDYKLRELEEVAFNITRRWEEICPPTKPYPDANPGPAYDDHPETTAYRPPEPPPMITYRPAIESYGKRMQNPMIRHDPVCQD